MLDRGGHVGRRLGDAVARLERRAALRAPRVHDLDVVAAALAVEGRGVEVADEAGPEHRDRVLLHRAGLLRGRGRSARLYRHLRLGRRPALLEDGLLARSPGGPGRRLRGLRCLARMAERDDRSGRSQSSAMARDSRRCRLAECHRHDPAPAAIEHRRTRAHRSRRASAPQALGRRRRRSETAGPSPRRGSRRDAATRPLERAASTAIPRSPVPTAASQRSADPAREPRTAGCCWSAAGPAGSLGDREELVVGQRPSSLKSRRCWRVRISGRTRSIGGGVGGGRVTGHRIGLNGHGVERRRTRSGPSSATLATPSSCIVRTASLRSSSPARATPRSPPAISPYR